jgi:potassium efflux system protein
MIRRCFSALVLLAALLAAPVPASAQDNSLRAEATPPSAPVATLPADELGPPLADALLPNSAADAPAIAAAPPAPPEAEAAPTEPTATSEPENAETADDDKEKKLVAPDPAKRKSLEDRLAALESAGLAEDAKQKATELYRQAIASFDVATQQIDIAETFEADLARIEAGDQSTQAYAEKLARPLPPYDDVSGESVEEIEKRAARLETNLAYYRDELAKMIAEPKKRSQRMAELPKQIADANERLKAASEELASLDADDAADAVAAARRQTLTYAKIEFEATLRALRCEQRLYKKGADWVATRRDYYARYVPHKEKRLDQLHEIINRVREEAAQEQARLASAAADAVEATRPKEILALANVNKALADELVTISESLSAATQDHAKAQTTILTLSEQFDRARLRAQEISSADGQLLRDQQSKLPDLRILQRRHATREPLLSELQLRAFDLYDQSSELANLDDKTDEVAAQVGDLSAETRAEVRCLLEAKRDTLKALVKAYEDYSNKLNLVHAEEAKLIAKVSEYAAFIAERVLWIRSCAPPSPRDLSHAMHAFAWSLDPHNWRDAGQAIVGTSRRKPVQFSIGVLGLAAIVVTHRAARRQLRELGAEASKRGCTRLRPTIHSLWLTALVALPWPALLALVGWTMDNLNESEFVRALGGALRFTAVCLLLLELARNLCRQNGLADAHFDWPSSCLTHVRNKFRWITMLGLPATLWLVGLELQAEESYWSSSLGRAMFVGVMLLLSAVWHRVLLAAKSPFRQLALIEQGGWLAPLQVVWRPAIVLLPSALAVLALTGYYYTAQQAAVRILQSAGMLLAALTLGGVTRRWLLVSRRRLAREQAKQRRAQLAAVADDDPGSLPSAEMTDEAVDLAALGEQTQKLVRTFLAITTTIGLFVIWAAILPALKYPAQHLLPGATELTWGHLVASLIVLVVTYVCVRDVPALLELVILQHLPLDSGARYAFTSMSRYLMAAVGLTAAFNAIGAKWSSIQWLVAAMSVGLGFGLQEIFANFVSGIILLFERPIRVGDVVTLGETSGVVSRIRMRATTVIDHDRKEYIVPNKDLISGRLLNWTLSDSTNRLVVNLGIAYEADVTRACELLLESAREQPCVLKEPAPIAFFDSFGDSSLNLKLLCFLPNLENRWQTIHGLNSAINDKFKQAGIEIPFPQRDLNVRFNEGAFSVDLEGAPINFNNLLPKASTKGSSTGTSRQGAA